MSLKTKVTLISALATIVVVISFTFFQEYRATNSRLFQTVSALNMVNHAGHEIAIEILLDIKDDNSIYEHLERIPIVTQQLQKIYSDVQKPAEIVDMEMSFVRIKRVVDDLVPGRPIPKPILEQIRNEIEKINRSVAKLKNLSEQESMRLKARSEFMIMTIYLVLVGYIMFMFVLLLKMVIIPILVISRQIEQVGLGERDKVTKASRKDEIGQLAEAFNKMNERRKQVEAELREEIRQHQETLEDKKVLSGLIPICASCKNIRDDKGYWNQIEIYIREHSEAEFSHGLCPDCVKKLYPQHSAEILKEEHPNTEDNLI